MLSDATLRWVSGGTGGAGRDRTDDILLAKQTLSQLSYGPMPFLTRMVGPGRLELPTSRLSGVRSNHLSYGPSGSRQRAGSYSRRAQAVNCPDLTREYVACEERETKAAKFRKTLPDLAACVPMKTREPKLKGNP